ncbi:MAG TPA: plastocyanin/azurin family copper-binding protein [Solirubrobacteraceae bacterium]|nr:plastocyanin/azurin family copper-binding protein [Solirubrobacteraceae bacterium]
MHLKAERQTRSHLTRTALLLALVGALALAGCGSSSSSKSSSSASAPAATPTTSSATTPATSSGAVQTVDLAANPGGQLKYDKSSFTVKPGRVNIVFTNMSPLEHNVTVESSGHATLGATPTFKGGSKTLSVMLTAGTYKFFCSVPGHRAAGMEGTITVQ